MVSESGNLDSAVNPYMHVAEQYFQKFIEGVRRHIAQESTYDFLHAEVQVSFDNRTGFSSSYSIKRIEGGEDLDGAQLRKALDAVSSEMPLARSLVLPGSFDFGFYLKGEAINCNANLRNDSLSDFLLETALQISLLVTHQMQISSVFIEAKCVYELSFSLVNHDGNCISLSGETNQVVERFIIAATKDYAINAQIPADRIPPNIQIRFVAEGSKLSSLVAPISTINPRSHFRQILSARPQTLSHLELYRIRFERHPNNPIVTLKYYEALARWGGEAISKENAWHWIESARHITRLNPEVSRVHEIFGKLLADYADAHNRMDQYIDEIVTELRLARALDSTKTESLIRFTAILLVSANRQQEALTELLPEEFAPFRLPNRTLCFSYLHLIADICEKIGDMEPARLLIEDAISMKGSAQEAHWQILYDRCKKKIRSE